MRAHFVLQGVFYGELFGEVGLVLGTSLDPVTTYFIEPAFVNSTVRLPPITYACTCRDDDFHYVCSNHQHNMLIESNLACNTGFTCLVTVCSRHVWNLQGHCILTLC